MTSRIGQIGVPAAVVFVAVMMVVPLPAPAIDILITANLAFSVVILLSSMYVDRPLDFSIFPSLLLIATLYRLALNVSTTRRILLDGYAGKVVESFGHVVIGGSLVVGLVIFFILIVIQFVVVTNGASRVAEVGARFTLDAMPGKQMAIDADLNAGIITEEEARKRRHDISAEADFYGAMDGASKFVKGDAIAAILIVFINLVGGFIIGLQNGMSVSESVQHYSLLTVGDGLAAQIPSLLISIASGLIVTRASDDADMGSTLVTQLGAHAKAMRIASITLLALAALPGLPKVPFLGFGAVLWFVSMRAAAAQKRLEEAPVAEAAPAPPTDTPDQIASDMRVEPVALELGVGLVDLVDQTRGGDLLSRVRALRRKVAMELGIVLPPVRTRDSLELEASSYSIKVHGVEVGRGEAPEGMVLVLGQPPEGIPARHTKDPVFGLDAAWVPAGVSVHAELNGLTVVDRGSVITAHLSEAVRSNAARLLGRQDTKMLVETVRSTDPAVVEELNASGLTLAMVQQVLQGLLAEQVPIRDLVRILEALTARAASSKDVEVLTESARAALGPAIAAVYAQDNRLPVLTLDPVVEQALIESVRPSDSGTYLAIEHEIAERVATAVRDRTREAEERGDRPALVCSPAIRPALRRLVRTLAPQVPVLSFHELGDQLTIDAVGVVSLVPTTV